jgi:hypothetical protein
VNLLKDIASLATLITVAGGAIYILGLMTLAWPIYAQITKKKDISTTWYAVSLIPKTVVAGQGVRVLIRYALLATLFSLLSGMVPLIVLQTTLLFSGSLLAAWTLAVLTLIATVAITTWASSGARGHWLFGEKGRNPVSRVFAFTITAASYAMGGLAGILLGGGAIEMDRLFPPHITVNQSLLVKALMLAIGGSFLLAISHVAKIDPPLPDVKITLDKGEGGDRCLKGKLVAHSDGVWYIFDKRATLTSVPDDKVTTAQVGNPQVE